MTEESKCVCVHARSLSMLCLFYLTGPLLQEALYTIQVCSVNGVGEICPVCVFAQTFQTSHGPRCVVVGQDSQIGKGADLQTGEVPGICCNTPDYDF